MFTHACVCVCAHARAYGVCVSKRIFLCVSVRACVRACVRFFLFFNNSCAEQV